MEWSTDNLKKNKKDGSSKYFTIDTDASVDFF